MKELVQNKDIYREDTFSTKLLFQTRYFFTRRYNTCIIIALFLIIIITVIIVIINIIIIIIIITTDTFWKVLIFPKNNIPHYLIFLESDFFRRAIFQNILF